MKQTLKLAPLAIVPILMIAAVCQGRSVDDVAWATPSGRSCPKSNVARLPPLRQTGAPNTGTISSEASFAAASQGIPGGLAAVFMAGNRTVVFLVDTTKADSALVAVRNRRGIPQLDFAHAEIRSARWTFAELYEWYNYLKPLISSRYSTETGIDQPTNGIIIGTADLQGRDSVLRLIGSLNVPCHLVGVTVIGMPRPADERGTSRRAVP